MNAKIEMIIALANKIGSTYAEFDLDRMAEDLHANEVMTVTEINTLPYDVWFDKAQPLRFWFGDRYDR